MTNHNHDFTNNAPAPKGVNLDAFGNPKKDVFWFAGAAASAVFILTILTTLLLLAYYGFDTVILAAAMPTILLALGVAVVSALGRKISLYIDRKN